SRHQRQRRGHGCVGTDIASGRSGAPRVNEGCRGTSQMNSIAQLSLALFAACLSAAGCSKVPSAAPPAAAPISPCDSLVLKAADLGGLLHAPITHVTALAGDGQSCAFLTTGFSAVTVSVRPGLGKASLEAWSTGKMPLPVRPLDGVGDAAVWQ